MKKKDCWSNCFGDKNDKHCLSFLFCYKWGYWFSPMLLGLVHCLDIKGFHPSCLVDGSSIGNQLYRILMIHVHASNIYIKKIWPRLSSVHCTLTAITSVNSHFFLGSLYTSHSIWRISWNVHLTTMLQAGASLIPCYTYCVLHILILLKTWSSFEE